MTPKIETRLVADLIPYAANSRTHSDAQVAQIAASIKEFGWTNPILVSGDDSIIAGHGRLMAARKLGMEEVPVIVLDHLSKSQQRALVIADNQLALNAGWNMDMLKAEIEDLQLDDFDLSILGFDDKFLDGLLEPEPTAGLTDEDAVPEVPETPKTVLGDVWVLGNHRLMCGDSTSIDAVDKLMNGTKIDLVHTDPPYGINEKCDRAFASRTRLAKGNSFEQILNDDSIDCAIEAFNLVQTLNVPRQVWWGANYYAHSVPQTANWFVWDKRVEENQKDANSDCELAWVKSKWSSVRIFRHLWKGMIKASEHGQGRVHPTQKPIALVEWVFEYYKDVVTVLDLFGGSGSTLMAAEKRNKQSFLMELSPAYCDVIIKRWQDFTGKEVVHAETGETFNGSR
jgi:DNA modification methylase